MDLDCSQVPDIDAQLAINKVINRRIAERSSCNWKPTKTPPTEPGWYPMQIAHVEWHYDKVYLVDGELCIFSPNANISGFVPIKDLHPDLWWGPKAAFPPLEVGQEIVQEEMEL